MKELTNEQAYTKAAHLCSLGEKAPQEIIDKLTGWGVRYEQAKAITERLKSENFIDEKRFVHAFVHDKFTYEHWGKIKIAYALRNKGIDDSLIDNTIDDVIDDEEYLAAAISVVRSKLSKLPQPLSQNDKAKVFRFAAQRGFESNVISAAIAREVKTRT